ncbi:hypothetical protein [Leucobacter chironomi]|uniref:hypothetical protein n=1 Tax=Leucobacter chironomi TaxID=491918 RepID=UPI0004083D77|nr:hypothetical protein [Leucobacter chironomi]
MVDVYVIGGGLPELAAALELGEVGLSVRLGDWDLGSAEPAVGRAHAEAGGDSTSALLDPDGVLRQLLDHVAAPIAEGGHAHTGARPVAVPPSAVLVHGAKAHWVPQPVPASLGIPAVPISSQAVAVLGGRAAARAYLDRVKPVLTIGKAHSLGDLVRNRLGETVVERLVDPFVRERFGVAPDDVEVAVAVPGLNEALTRAGSLSGAVLANSDRDVARETAVIPEAGWGAAFAGLHQRLELYGAKRADATVVAVERIGDEAWRIEEADGTTVEARAVVAGLDAGSAFAAGRVLHALPGELLPRRWRLEVRTAVAGAPLEARQSDALCAVQLSDGSRWAVRIEATEPGEGRARLSGPAFEAAANETGLPAEHRARSESAAAEALAGVGLSAGAASEAILRVAPHISVDERDAALRSLQACRENTDDLLAVGDALHGGSVAAAVADARTQAVLLRRRLAGIAD